MMKYTSDHIEFLTDFIPGHHYKEIAEEFNLRFPETPITAKQVSNFCKHHKVHTGFTGLFEKGCISHNKGKKMPKTVYEKLKPHMYVKGCCNKHNKKQIGTLHLNCDGYYQIKVKEKGQWPLRGRYVWEQHYGQIPKGYTILHINGDKTNDDIENLALLKRSELVRLNQSGLFGKDKEVNKSAIALAKLKSKIFEKKKGDKK